MKTRYLTVFLTAAGAMFALSSCDTGSATLDPNVEARLRNDLPAYCTAEQINACPAVQVTRCPGGQEPVIDYVSDCCARFTCQPLCSSPNQRTCPMTPAPTCPARTRLWIGTAIEDCCPAYRCEPDGSTCDATNVACTLARPYCGPDIEPVVVGQSADCCPIYQCPCRMPTDPVTGAATPPEDLRFCGCTTPSCQAGYKVVCEGKDACGGPCTCEPARGICKGDDNCGADERCDLSACRLPPEPAATDARAACDVAKCGPRPGLPNRICADGTTAGPTDRCLMNADGSCGWEVRECPPEPGCYGICVPNIQRGCRADADCPSSQVCEIACTGWGCSAGGTPVTNDPSTGLTPPPGAICGCDATTDRSCVCDAAGNCKGQICEGKCAPKPPTCDPARPVACPAIALVCPNNARPVDDGIDPTTCCPKYRCPPVCDRTTASTTGASICPAIECKCARQVATDPVSCCPKYECRPVNADGTCG